MDQIDSSSKLTGLQGANGLQAALEDIDQETAEHINAEDLKLVIEKSKLEQIQDHKLTQLEENKNDTKLQSDKFIIEIEDYDYDPEKLTFRQNKKKTFDQELDLADQILEKVEEDLEYGGIRKSKPQYELEMPKTPFLS